MPALVDYLRLAEGQPRKIQTLRAQWTQAVDSRRIDCAACTQPRALELAYRCLYCGVWFCAPCAEVHFGETIPEYHARQQRPECARRPAEQLRP